MASIKDLFPKARFGPFRLLEGKHIELDPIRSEESTKRAREESRKTGYWNGKPIAEADIDKHVVVREERVYSRGDEPFMSVHDLTGVQYNRPGFPPKFQLVGDALQEMHIDQRLLRQPGESMADFANRMVKLAQEGYGEEAAAEPEPQPAPAGKGKR